MVKRGVIFFTALLVSNFVYALPEDQSQPLYIKADFAKVNNKQKINEFTGNVRVDQGSTHLRAKTLLTYSNAEGKLIKLVATGDLAEYSTLPKKGDSELLARAKTILYFPLDKQAILLDSAQVEQNKNLFTGAKITYDMQKDVVYASASSNQQTTIIIQPETVDKSKG